MTYFVLILLVLAFLGGAAAMFFFARVNPSWLGVEKKVQMMMDEIKKQRGEKKAELIKKINDTQSLAKAEVVKWLEAL
jgi:uncharacterized membrane-anchored protein YhcB (DUF1043 family)